MYNLSKQLKEIGFNIDLLQNAIERNANLNKFNTLEYFCIYVFLKDFKLKVDGELIIVSGGEAVFLSPFRTIEFMEKVHADIYVIAFTPLFYEKSKKDSLFLNSEVFFSYNGQVQAIPYFGTTEYIKSMMTDRLKYFKDADQSLYLAVAHSIIETLLLDALMYVSPIHKKEQEVLSLISVGNSFKTLLQKDIRINRTVSHYASELCISERKLTNVIRELYGKTAKQIIIQKFCNDCVIALTHSNLTISEISFEFGFSSESNFANFLRKHTGKTPTELRIFSQQNTN
nr:AraC family transcriptional regulator [uncultured Chryseobacterium sp.]